MDLKDVITLVLATVGAVLGVVNAWRNWQLDRVRLRVRGVRTVHLTTGAVLIGVEVANLSNFPITVEEVGFGSGRGHALGQDRAILHQPIMSGAESMPVRLESRAAFTAYGQPGTGEHQVKGGLIAFARTACGKTGWDPTPEVLYMALAPKNPPR